MTRKLVLMLAILAITIIANMNLKAHTDPPCDFPCEDEIWNYHYEQVFPVGPSCPGCFFYVTYHIQTKTCNLITNFNVYVDKIAWSTSCEACYPNVQALYFAGYNLLLQSVITQFTGVKDIVTFSHIACVSYSSPDRTGVTPCPGSTDCCLTTTTWEYINGQWICTNELLYVPEPVCVSPCWPNCIGDWPQKKSISKSYQLSKPEIIPNPAKDLLTVSFDADYIGNIKLEIFNLNGDIVQSVTRDKKNNSFATPIDISELVSGSYIIYIYINDSQMIWSNKFIIEK
jgi:hypothetical protein